MYDVSEPRELLEGDGPVAILVHLGDDLLAHAVLEISLECFSVSHKLSSRVLLNMVWGIGQWPG